MTIAGTKLGQSGWIWGLTVTTHLKRNAVDRRNSLVNAAIGSVRAEGLEPSNELIKALQSYIAGTKTIEEIIQETKEKYRALSARD